MTLWKKSSPTACPQGRTIITSPWTVPVCLVLLGAALQWSVGPVPWHVLCLPGVSLAVTAAFLALSVGWAWAGQRPILSGTGGGTMAVAVLASAATLTVLMGLITQRPTHDDGRPWGMGHMLAFWPFVLVWLWLALALATTVLRAGGRTLQTATCAGRGRTALVPMPSAAVLMHAGLLVVLLAAGLGAPGRGQVRMTLRQGELPRSVAASEDGTRVGLPMCLELRALLRAEGKEGVPAARLAIYQVRTPGEPCSDAEAGAVRPDSPDPQSSPTCVMQTVAVNHPLRVEGWDVRLHEVRPAHRAARAGAAPYSSLTPCAGDECVLELVREPVVMRLGVLSGGALLLLGALRLLSVPLVPRLRRRDSAAARSIRIRTSLLALGGLALALVAWGLISPVLHAGGLPPVLRSPWFVPHVALYMVAYALLSVAAVRAAWILCLTAVHRGGAHSMEVCDVLTRAGVALLTLGMLSGALWAKAAWGHYWAWDPKETWALATWLTCLLYLHLRLRRPQRRGRAALSVLVLAFALLQMCWWGVNLLPAGRGMSLHTYV